MRLWLFPTLPIGTLVFAPRLSTILRSAIRTMSRESFAESNAVV